MVISRDDWRGRKEGCGPMIVTHAANQVIDCLTCRSDLKSVWPSEKKNNALIQQSSHIGCF